MAEARTEVQSGETGLGKIEDIVLLAFCGLIAVGGVAVVVWLLVAGNLLSIDGLCLAAICLSISAVFGGCAAWSFHTGEVNQLLGGGAKEAAAAPVASRPAAAATVAKPAPTVAPSAPAAAAKAAPSAAAVPPLADAGKK